MFIYSLSVSVVHSWTVMRCLTASIVILTLKVLVWTPSAFSFLSIRLFVYLVFYLFIYVFVCLFVSSWTVTCCWCASVVVLTPRVLVWSRSAFSSTARVVFPSTTGSRHQYPSNVHISFYLAKSYSLRTGFCAELCDKIFFRIFVFVLCILVIDWLFLFVIDCCIWSYVRPKMSLLLVVVWHSSSVRVEII